MTQRFGSSTTVPPGELRTATASCEPGEVVTGGGVTQFSINFLNQDNPGTFTSGNAVQNPTEWRYDYFNPGPIRVQIQAVAECAKLVEAP